MQTRTLQRRTTSAGVITTAERLFVTRSYAATTIRDIAEEAGVSIGTVMSVDDKAGLLVRVFDRHIRRIHEGRNHPDAPTLHQPEAPTPADAATQVERLVEPFITLFTDSPGPAREYAAILVSGRHSSEVFRELADSLLGELTSVLRATGLTEATATAAGRTIYLAYLGLIFSWAGSGQDASATFRDDLRGVVASVMSAGRR